MTSIRNPTRIDFDKVIPFKVQMKLDIPNLEGNIDEQYGDSWIQQLESYFSANQLYEAEKVTLRYLQMSTSVQYYWWENLSTKSQVDSNSIDTWEIFFEHVKKEFYPCRYIKQQYKKW